MNITPFQIGERFTGIDEISGEEDSPFVMSMLTLDATWPEHDEVPWCSAFINYCCWLLRLPRSKSLMARSWLAVGTALDPREAVVGWDVVILSRGAGEQPGPRDLTAPGHVGFYAGRDNENVYLLGGNQSNSVGVSGYKKDRILGIRRLA